MGFEVGMEKTGGRRAGVQNKYPRLLKEAVMIAAELEGMDGRGKDQLVGFLRFVAREDLRAFCSLLGRVIPYQIETKNDQRVQVTYKSVADVRAEMAERGISIELVQKLVFGKDEPLVIEHDANLEDDDDDK
jgi:hypothetical protein